MEFAPQLGIWSALKPVGANLMLRSCIFSRIPNARSKVWQTPSWHNQLACVHCLNAVVLKYVVPGPAAEASPCKKTSEPTAFC